MMEKTIVQNKEDYEKIAIKENHTKLYLDNLKKTTYKDKKVVFILPSGKEYKPNDK